MPTAKDVAEVATGRARRILNKALTVMALAAIIGGVGATGAQAAWRVNAAQIYTQENPNWCWAAVSRTVIKYATGNAPTQCRIFNWGKQVSSCYDDSGSFSDDVTRALRGGGLRSTGIVYAQSTNFPDTVNEINANRLVMLRWEWLDNRKGPVGHMLIIRGYDTGSQNVSVIDPGNTDYSESIAHWWMVSSPGHHRWTHSRLNMY